jgi:hypothetical protein
LQPAKFRYARDMVSDRMIQAIGTLERAVSRLERDIAALAENDPMSRAAPGLDPSGAKAALKSLDELIIELRGRAGG